MAQELSGFFRRSEVGESEATSASNSHQCDPGDVMSLATICVPTKICFSITKLLQDLFHSTATGDGVPVESVYAYLWKQGYESFLDSLGSRGALAQSRELALGAAIGDSPLLRTIVALGDIPVFVVSEGNITAVAAE